MKKNKNLDCLEWFLVLISPITFGTIICVFIYFFITRHYGLEEDDWGVLFIPIYLVYIFFWAKAYRKVNNRSWLD